MLRLAGIVLTLIGILHQLGATCSGFVNDHAWLSLYGHRALHAFIAQTHTHAHRHPGHHEHHHHPVTPREESPDTDGHDHASHLCSATHATYPPPTDKVVFVPDLCVEWPTISHSLVAIHDLGKASGSYRDLASIVCPSAPARAELQIFQI